MGYGHQLGWASFRAPGFESTLWGGRLGKRSAEADAEPGYGYGYYGHGYYGHGLRGVAGHPSGTSYTFRSPQGLGKNAIVGILNLCCSDVFFLRFSYYNKNNITN